MRQLVRENRPGRESGREGGGLERESGREGGYWVGKREERDRESMTTNQKHYYIKFIHVLL